MTTMTELEARETTVPVALLLQVESSAASPAEMPEAMNKAFMRLMDIVMKYGLKTTGAPRAIYLTWGAAGTKFMAAVPVADAPPKVIEEAGVSFAAMPEQQALRFVHYGTYASIPETYGRIEQWLRARGGIKTQEDWAKYSPMWEEYVTDPATTQPADLVTHIYLPLR